MPIVFSRIVLDMFLVIDDSDRKMMKFIGSIEAKADAKGRVFLPSVFRKALQSLGDESLVLRPDVFQPCLVLYPESVWNAQVDDLRSRLSRWNATHQRIFRQFVSDVELLSLDGSGRFLLPKRFMQMAGIEQSVSFLGMGDSIEIWSSGRMEQSLFDGNEYMSALQEIMGGGKE